MSKPLYSTGDYVEIENYGHAIWESKQEMKTNTTSFPVIEENDTYRLLDMRPGLVGKKALVIEHTETQGQHKYSLEIEDIGHVSWFIEDQMKLIKANQSKL